MSRWDFVYGKEYWRKAGRTNPIHEICYGFTLEQFKTKKESMWFGLEKYANKNTKFAEIGCGMGRIAHWVAPCVESYVGMDISDSMVNEAIEYNKQFGFDNCSYVVGTNLSDIVGESSLDIVFSELVFIHITREEQLEYIEDAFKSLKEGGICSLQIPNHTSYVNGFDPSELKRILEKFFQILKFNAEGVLISFVGEKKKI